MPSWEKGPGEPAPPLDYIENLHRVTRFEVIDHTYGGEGRILVRYGVKVDLSYQDQGRTLKVFLSTRPDDRECS